MGTRISVLLCTTLFVALLSGSLRAAAAPDKPATQPAIDAAAVEALVDDLASDSFSVRQAATQKLEDMGPEVIAALEPFKKSDNPEIRGRVISIIRAFDWMKRGALIYLVWPGQPGEKIGLRFGDVVLKINGTPINGHMDTRTVGKDVDGPSMWTVWRDNKILRITVPKERLSIWMIDWNAEHGGIEQARAFREMHAAKPDFDHALRDLLAARKAGTKDMFSMFYLSGLSARAMHVEQAAEAYEQARITGKDCCELTHRPILSPMDRLPFDGPATQYFLKLYRAQPYEPELAHEIEDWCSQQTRNGPLLKELLPKTTPQQWQDEISYSYYHYRAAMRVAFTEHRDADVLASPLRNDDYIEYDVDDERAVLMLQSALRLGKVPEAAKTVASHGSEHRSYNRLHEYELWTFSAACAADDRQSIDVFLKKFKKLQPNDLDALFRTVGGVSLQHPAALAELRKWWESTKSTNHRTPIAILSFAALAADPATTAEQFKAAIPPEPAKPPRAQNEALYVATGLVRFGEYEQAAKLISSKDKKAYGTEAQRIVKDAADFAAKHRDELAGKWKELTGFIQVVRSGDKATWVLRYDGAVFRVDADGTLAAMPPLPPAPAPLTVGFAHLVPRSKGVFAILPYPRRNAATDDVRIADPIFCTDASQKQWLPLAQFDGKFDYKPNNSLRRGIALARADRDHPLPGGRPHQIADIQSPLFLIEGDLAYSRNEKTDELLDLSTEIAKLAGRKEPAHVYAPGSRVDAWRLLFSDCGVWRFNHETWELQRVKLGLPDENVMTMQMAGDHYTAKKEGFQVVGVAPQQGGQMFLVSPTTGEFEPVKAFCGLGPKDWYGYTLSRHFIDEMQSPIHAIYLSRLEKTKQQ